MGQDLERYQQEIDTAYQPIVACLEHYHGALSTIRAHLKTFFFDNTRIQKITEPVEGDEVVFSFNLVKSAMECCLIDENTLIEKAQDAKDANRFTSLVAAFDANSLSAGLPLEIHENGLYVFIPAKPYTANAQMFMEQFAYALSVYRMCLYVYEAYFMVCNYQGINTVWLHQYIELANGFKQQIDEDVNLLALYEQIIYREDEVIGMLSSRKIYEGFSELKTNSDELKTRLDEQLTAGANHLEEGYKKFPNDAILWMLHDRSWHSLVKTLSGILYSNEYTSSTLYGTFQIKRHIILRWVAEIDNFNHILLTNTPLIKIEILRKAAKLIGEAKIDVLAKLAEKVIELPQILSTPRFPFQDSPVSNNIYTLLFHATKSLRSAEEHQQLQPEF